MCKLGESTRYTARALRDGPKTGAEVVAYVGKARGVNVDRGIFVLGVTGSVGMGKSTTSSFFSKAGVPVWDADATVRKLYENNTNLNELMARLVPSVPQDGKINRTVRRHSIKQQPKRLKILEALVQPYIAADLENFLTSAASANLAFVVIDNPWLFETGEHNRCDAVLVVSASPEEQKKRVLSREGMTEDTFQMLLAKQMPDSEKRKLADYVLETTTLEAAKNFVSHLIEETINSKQEAQQSGANYPES